MFRAFVAILVSFAIYFTCSCEIFAMPENQNGEVLNHSSRLARQEEEALNLEVFQVIEETTTVANFIKRAGGEKDAELLIKRRNIVQEKQQENDRRGLLIALQSLRAEVLLRHAYLNIALAALIHRQNTTQEIRALQFINRAEYLLKSIEKRINSILGDR